MPASPLPAWAVGLGTSLSGGAPAAPLAALPPAAVADSSDPAVMSERADAAFTGGNYAEAAALYERLLGSDPQNVELHNNLGLTLHYLGRSGEALERLAAGLRIDPGHQRSWLTTGFVHLQVGNTAEARTALTHARDAGDDGAARDHHRA